MIILAGDVGGTKTNLAFFRAMEQNLALITEGTYPSRSRQSLGQLVRDFAAEKGFQADYACLGIAGPVYQGVAYATNLPWRVKTDDLEAETGLEEIRLINDLEATAYGIEELEEDELKLLHPGDPSIGGNIGVIAAGTGLGEAGGYWDGEIYQAFPSEGGHSSFAPRNELETDLLHFLRRDYRHVSWERVLSGMGLHNLYRFLAQYQDNRPDPAVAETIRQADDPPKVISEAGLAERCPVCGQALDLFVSLYGAEAGNLALKFLATGGLFIGGGIAPQILPALEKGLFMEAFLAKGRMQSLLEKIPVRIILTNKTALYGAAHCAMYYGLKLLK